MLESMHIRLGVYGKEHRTYAASCNNLAVLYNAMGRYKKAESLYLQARQLKEKTLGKEHPEYAMGCGNLADLYRKIGDYAKAEPLFQRGLQNTRKSLGPGTKRLLPRGLAFFYRAPS